MTLDEQFAPEMQSRFHLWLASQGFAGSSLEAKRCRIHGYAMQGIYHYPANGDNHTYYECINCLWDLFEQEVLA